MQGLGCARVMVCKCKGVERLGFGTVKVWKCQGCGRVRVWKGYGVKGLGCFRI